MGKLSRSKASERALRVLWVVDTMREAHEDAQMSALIGAVDRGRVRLDLLVLGSDKVGALGRDVEAAGGNVFFANAQHPGDIGASRRAKGWIKSGKYDLIHTHMDWASLWGAKTGRKLRIPVVASLYGPRANQIEGPKQEREAEKLRKELRRSAARVIAMSGAQWDRYMQDGAFARSALEVVHQGVSVPENPLSPEERQAHQIWLRNLAGFKPGGQIAVTVADMDDWQSGVDVLFWALPDIVHKHPQTRFVIVGTGEHRDELDRRTRARGLNSYVHWHTPDADVRRILEGSDLFIHPSLRDPFPIAVVRAMAAGLPIVGTRVGAVPEIIGTAQAGRLVPRGNQDALAAAVIELLDDPLQLAGMGRAAHARAQSMFTVEGWMERILRVYETVVDDHRMGRELPTTFAHLDVKLLGPRPKRRRSEQAAPKDGAKAGPRLPTPGQRRKKAELAGSEA